MADLPGTLDITELSEQQRRFATRVGSAGAVRCADRAVCLYRVIQHETIRWIVAVDGSVLDWTVFHGR